MDVADSVVVAAANGTDRKTVTTSARAAREGDIGTRVNSDTVILGWISVLRGGQPRIQSTNLVVNDSIGDGDASRASDIEGICDMSKSCSGLFLR